MDSISLEKKKSGCENRTRVSASTRLKDNHYPNPDAHWNVAPEYLKYVSTSPNSVMRVHSVIPLEARGFCGFGTYSSQTWLSRIKYT